MERMEEYFECTFCKGFFGVGSRARESTQCSHRDTPGGRCKVLVGRYPIVEQATEWLSPGHIWWRNCPRHRPCVRDDGIHTVKEIIKLLLEKGQATTQEFEVKNISRDFIQYCLDDC